MEPRSAYPTEKIYPAFAHRELSVSWIVLAALLGGRHRIEPGFLSSGFHYLEFGCGPGLNLLFNAVAHPEASFHGVDLNPTHIAEATARARDLGVEQRDLRAGGSECLRRGAPHRAAPPVAGRRPTTSWWPMGWRAGWALEVRQALVAAAGPLLRPGGLFFCSYNTYPGWLSRSTLQMLSQEKALRAGGSTTPELLRRSAELLLQPLRRGGGARRRSVGRFPGLRSEMERHPLLRGVLPDRGVPRRSPASLRGAHAPVVRRPWAQRPWARPPCRRCFPRCSTRPGDPW